MEMQKGKSNLPKEIHPSQIKGRWIAEMNNRIKIEYVKILKIKEDKTNKLKSSKERWLENGAITELENGKLTMKQWDQHL